MKPRVSGAITFGHDFRNETYNIHLLYPNPILLKRAFTAVIKIPIILYYERETIRLRPVRAKKLYRYPL